MTVPIHVAIHEAPTISEEFWYADYSNVIDNVFGVQEFEYDRMRADAEEAKSLVIRTKLELVTGNGRISNWVADLTFDGVPFAIHTSVGKRSDIVNVVITDREAFGRAFAYVNTFRRHEAIDIHDPSASEKLRDIGGGTLIIRHAGELRLVPHEHVSEEGNLLFDERVFKERFIALVKSAPWQWDEFRLRKSDHSVGVAEAIRAAISGDVECVVLDRFDEHKDWLAAAIRTDEGTYLIGVRSYNAELKGIRSVHPVVVRCGGPERFAEIDQLPSPAV